MSPLQVMAGQVLLRRHARPETARPLKGRVQLQSLYEAERGTGVGMLPARGLSIICPQCERSIRGQGDSKVYVGRARRHARRWLAGLQMDAR